LGLVDEPSCEAQRITMRKTAHSLQQVDCGVAVAVRNSYGLRSSLLSDCGVRFALPFYNLCVCVCVYRKGRNVHVIRAREKRWAVHLFCIAT
jgi:hypothetical protein